MFIGGYPTAQLGFSMWGADTLYAKNDSDIEVSERQQINGRPSIAIEESQLSFFVDSVKDMALILGCSKQTIERRLSKYHLSTRRLRQVSKGGV